MEKSSFLNGLKNAVENGEFNSDAAKRIKEINDLAEYKLENLEKTQKSFDEKINNPDLIKLNDQEIVKINETYDKSLIEIEKIDLINSYISEIINYDESILKLTLNFISYINDLKIKYEKENIENDPKFEELFLLINRMEIKYCNFV